MLNVNEIQRDIRKYLLTLDTEDEAITWYNTASITAFEDDEVYKVWESRNTKSFHIVCTPAALGRLALKVAQTE